MAAIQIEFQPVCEPVTLAQLQAFTRLQPGQDDVLLATLGIAAREYCEEWCRRKFINAGLIQSLDSFPYFTDTIMSQMAYPPSYYSLPRYSTTLWNYSQMMKMFYSKLASVTTIDYVASADGTWHTLQGTTDMSNPSNADFFADILSEPPRLFPKAGMYWPSVLYVPNAVQIHYIAGCNNDANIAAALEALSPPITPATNPANCSPQEAALRQADVPQRIVIAILQLVCFWYDHRDEWDKIDIPDYIHSLLSSYAVEDFAPTRG